MSYYTKFFAFDEGVEVVEAAYKIFTAHGEGANASNYCKPYIKIGILTQIMDHTTGLSTEFEYLIPPSQKLLSKIAAGKMWRKYFGGPSSLKF